MIVTSNDPNNQNVQIPLSGIGILSQDEQNSSPHEQNLIDWINGNRLTLGSAPLTFDQNAYDAALFHSTDMATNGFFSHQGSDGREWYERLNDYHVGSPFNELIASGEELT